jgi:hypothetical protein
MRWRKRLTQADLRAMGASPDRLATRYRKGRGVVTRPSSRHPTSMTYLPWGWFPNFAEPSSGFFRSGALSRSTFVNIFREPRALFKALKSSKYPSLDIGPPTLGFDEFSPFFIGVICVTFARVF